MADTVSPHISRVVNKLPLDITEEEAVTCFWERCAPGTRENCGDKTVELYERQVRSAYRERVRREARLTMDMVA